MGQPLVADENGVRWITFDRPEVRNALRLEDLARIRQAVTGIGEGTWLLANEMASLVFGFEFDVPEYVSWLQTVDMEGASASHRRQIQHQFWVSTTLASPGFRR